MSVFFESTYPVDTRDVDPQGVCRSSAVLGILQEAAADAAIRLKVSREEMLESYNAFWMLARIWYRLDRPLRWGERVGVKTWHRGGKGAAMYRDFDLTVDGAPVGEAVSNWVLADADTHKLLRLSGVAEFEGSGGGALCKDRLLGKLRLPEGLTLSERRRMHYSDTDINGHVNNSKYADFTCDALRFETLGAGRFISTLQVGYLAECLPGETVDILTGEDGCTYFVHGVGGEGRARFDAALTLAALPLVSGAQKKIDSGYVLC